MLGMVDDWAECLALSVDEDEAALLRRHDRTGRPLGGASFVECLERQLDRVLHPRKRGPKGPGKK